MPKQTVRVYAMTLHGVRVLLQARRWEDGAYFCIKLTSEEELSWGFFKWDLSTTGSMSEKKTTILFDAAADKEDLFYPPLGFLYTSPVVPSLSDELVRDEEELENKGVLLFGLYFQKCKEEVK